MSSLCPPGASDTSDTDTPDIDTSHVGPPALIILAKVPVPGRVKTRLQPTFSPEQASWLAECALRDTLEAAATTVARRVVVVVERHGLAMPRWIADDFAFFDQCEGGLDARLAGAFDGVGEPAFLIGMDTPQVTTALLNDGLRTLAVSGSVIGPATDGGFWAIGLRQPQPAVFRGVAMSRPTTGRDQIERLHALGLAPVLLPELSDLDTPDDARRLAEHFPAIRTASAVRAALGSPPACVPPAPA